VPVVPTVSFESLFYSSVTINVFFLLLFLFVFRKKITQLRQRRQRNRPQQLNPIIRNTNPIFRSENDRYFSLVESEEDDSELRPLLNQNQTSASLSIPISRAPSVGQPAGSTTGWSWSDITLTPPLSVVRNSDPEQLRHEQARANANFLQMKTFKPIDVRNNIFPREPYNETTV
jgi:hypothetical protein